MKSAQCGQSQRQRASRYCPKINRILDDSLAHCRDALLSLFFLLRKGQVRRHSVEVLRENVTSWEVINGPCQSCGKARCLMSLRESLPGLYLQSLIEIADTLMHIPQV